MIKKRASNKRATRNQCDRDMIEAIREMLGQSPLYRHHSAPAVFNQYSESYFMRWTGVKYVKYEANR